MNKLWKRPSTAADVAEATHDPESFGRNLRDWQHELRNVSSRKEFVRRIAEAPKLLNPELADHAQCDAYLAAYVEWLCERHGVSTPRWIDEAGRVTNVPWFDYPPLWQDAFIHAPAAFRRRGVFTRPEDTLRFRPGRPLVSRDQKREKSKERQRRYRERIRQKLKRLESLEKSAGPL